VSFTPNILFCYSETRKIVYLSPLNSPKRIQDDVQDDVMCNTTILSVM